MKLAKKCIIVGCASCVWDDLKNLPKEYLGAKIVLLNDMIYSYPHHADYAISVHSESMSKWLKKRGEAMYNLPLEAIVYAQRYVGDFKIKTLEYGGSSGLFAVMSMIAEGYDNIMLCGVPMMSIPHFWGGEDWNHCFMYRKAWLTHLSEIKDKVHSMSGWTKKILTSDNP